MKLTLKHNKVQVVGRSSLSPPIYARCNTRVRETTVGTSRHLASCISLAYLADLRCDWLVCSVVSDRTRTHHVRWCREQQFFDLASAVSDGKIVMRLLIRQSRRWIACENGQPRSKRAENSWARHKLWWRTRDRALGANSPMEGLDMR